MRAVTASVREAVTRTPEPPDRWQWGTGARRADLGALTAYVLMAAYVLSGLIADPRGRYLSQGVQDHQLFEWFLGATAHNVTTGSNPLFSTLQNHPDGVNLLANTSLQGLGVPLTPLTLWAGPHVTFVVVEFIGYAATAWFWYWLFARRLVTHRGAAFVGGLLVGFSPGMLSHGNGHPNFLAQFLIPVLIDRLLDLGRPRTRRQSVRAGVVLGLLVTWQLWLGEEVLVLASVGIALATLVLAVHRRVPWRAGLPGLLVGVVTTTALFAVPVWWQFAGPQSYHGLFQPVANTDLAALWGQATRSLGSDPWATAALSLNRTEENAFWGVFIWPVVAVTALVCWRRLAVRGSVVVLVVACWLALGDPVTLHGERLPVPSLWSAFVQIPLMDFLLPTRMALIAVPALAALLAVGLDAAHSARRRRPMLVAGWGAAVLALLPMIPTPLWTDPRPGVPEFFTSGQWRDQVSGGAVLAAPPSDIVDLRAADWQAAARWEFPINAGYFVVPDGSPERLGVRGAPARPLLTWMTDIATSGTARVPSPAERRTFVADLRALQTDLIVLPDRPDGEPLLVSLTGAFGPGETAGGVTYWDVRALRGVTP